MAGKVETEKQAGACYWSKAVDCDRWIGMPPEARCRVQAVCMEGDPSSWAAPGSGFGRFCLYPQFEFAPLLSGQAPDYDETRERCFAPYRQLPARPIRFGRAVSPELEAVCRNQCALYRKVIQDGPEGRRPICSYDFEDSFCAEFELGQDEERKNSRRGAERVVRVRDLRLFGRPVEVVLWYSGRMPQGLREQIGSYPGFESGSVRCSLRLGNAIDKALLHNLPAAYLYEASALLPERIDNWKRTRILEASLALPQLVTRYTLENSDDYSAWTENRSFRVPDKLHDTRMEKYTFTYRREGEEPPRLISIYPASEWNLVRKLAATPLTQLMEKHELNLSPGRLFNLAVDFLSVTLSGTGAAARQAAPALGAMLFLSLCEEERAGCGAELFQKLDEPYSLYYGACYQALMQLYSDTGRAPWSDLPEMLRALLSREIQTELAGRVWDWYEACEKAAEERALRLVRCLSMRESFWSAPELERLTELTEGGAVSSVREFITRLLLFNPATLATVRSSQGRTRLIGKEGEYLCRFSSDGSFDFRNVVPGIQVDELGELLKQGFLREDQNTYLHRGAAGSEPDSTDFI